MKRDRDNKGRWSTTLL